MLRRIPRLSGVEVTGRYGKLRKKDIRDLFFTYYYGTKIKVDMIDGYSRKHQGKTNA
jgi:hypothetical protein